MHKLAITQIIFAIIVFFGGLMGYIKAGSLPSVIMSSIFAITLTALALYIKSAYTRAIDISLGIIFLLFAFFCYRLLLTQKIMPALPMLLMSAAMLIYLGRSRPSHKLK